MGRLMVRSILALWLTLAASVPVTLATPVVPATHTPLYGFTGFPYELSLEALDRVQEIITPASNLAAFHLDGPCVPWAEALAGEPFPDWLEAEWAGQRASVPADHTVYIAITPTSQDRQTLAQPCGSDDLTPGELPAGFAEAPLDDSAVVQAYIAYARRALDVFQPRYVNLAIEISELSLGAPDIWPQFAGLYLQTLDALRASHPDVGLGLELVVQSLLLPRVAEQVKPAVEASDYLGLSFYPYGSEFGEAVGAPSLPTPPAQWRDPLAFVRAYTDKPLAIAETGYTTQDVALPVTPEVTLHFRGDEATQTAFVQDLVEIARRDGYLFVIWFVPVDYPALQRALDAPPEDPGWIWAYAGLWSGPDQPKPAWDAWLAFAE